MLVRWYLAYSLSYRDVEELALERGLKVDHSTINRWVLRYAAQLEEHYKKNKMEDEWLKVTRLSPVAWQHINLIGIYEFYNNKECPNLHELIESLLTNNKINLLAVA